MRWKVSFTVPSVGPKFFFDVTLGRGELIARMQAGHVPQKLPVA